MHLQWGFYSAASFLFRRALELQNPVSLSSRDAMAKTEAEAWAPQHISPCLKTQAISTLLLAEASVGELVRVLAFSHQQHTYFLRDHEWNSSDVLNKCIYTWTAHFLFAPWPVGWNRHFVLPYKLQRKTCSFQSTSWPSSDLLTYSLHDGHWEPNETSPICHMYDHWGQNPAFTYSKSSSEWVVFILRIYDYIT